MKEEDVKKFWDKRSECYGKTTLHGITAFSDSEETKKRDKLEKQEIRKHIDFGTDRKILDLGCGVGRITMDLAKDVDFIVGVDYSQSLIDIASREAEKSGFTNIEFICASSYDFQHNEKFDVAVVLGLFSYMNDDNVVKTIKNISRHLKKGGKVTLKESVGLEERFEVIDKFSDELGTIYNSIYRTPTTLIRLFEENGFKVVHSKKFFQHRKETGMWFFVFRH
jgi:cyclopropane fatty-acyl-phospholipid synthase-like methyltransferase